MTPGSKRVALGAAVTLAALQAGLGAWFVAMAVEGGDSYAWWDGIGLVGGLAAVAALVIVPWRPKTGGALAYLGSLLGVTLWLSIVGVFLTCILMPAILAVTVIYDEMKTSAVAKLAVWTLSVLLLGICIFGLLLVAALIKPVPFIFWIFAAAILQIPVVVLVLASRSSQDPAGVIARAGGKA
jgi:hypothetical protein